MKSYTVLVFLVMAAVVVMEQDNTALKATLKKCAEKSNATMSGADDKGKIRAQYCYIACTYKAIGCMSPDNSINVEKIKQAMKSDMEPDKYKKIAKTYDECKTEAKPEADECEAVKKFFACTYKKKAEA